MWRISFKRPGCAGLPCCNHNSRDWPPRQARVVKPRISTLTVHRSRVRPRISAHMAAMVIERPRMEPELSMSRDTTVSLNFISFSCLKASGLNGSIMTLGNLEQSSVPSSRSNSQVLFCCAINFRCRRLASLLITICELCKCLSSTPRNLSSSMGSHNSSANTTSSNALENALYWLYFGRSQFLSDIMSGGEPASSSSPSASPISMASISSGTSPSIASAISPSADIS